MALIDTSDLLLDPDFTSVVTLIRRAVAVNEYGESVITETSQNITVVAQGDNTETLTKLPQGARLSDVLTVYYKGILTAERAGGYADIIVFGGKRYQVTEVTEDYMNYGAGWVKAICYLEPVHV